jgi:hypothetical protein
MRRGARPLVLFVVGAMVLGAYGCGGSPPGPSKTAFVQQVDQACTRPRTRTAVRTALNRLAALPGNRYARTKALRAAGRSLAKPVRELTAEVGRLPTPEGDQAVVKSWLLDLHKLAVLTMQAAATERRIIALHAHHPGVVERSGTVRNADLDHALTARRAAARTARGYGLAACARALSPG